MSQAMTTGMFSSLTDEWATPQSLFDTLNEEFHFDLDVCATPQNAKCNKYYTRKEDGLKQPWIGNCWMNPPYGREIGKWIEKAYRSATGGGDNCGMPPTSSHRHKILASVCHAGIRDTAYLRTRQVRRRNEQRTFPISDCYLWYSESAGYQECEF